MLLTAIGNVIDQVSEFNLLSITFDKNYLELSHP